MAAGRSALLRSARGLLRHRQSSAYQAIDFLVMEGRAEIHRDARELHDGTSHGARRRCRARLQRTAGKARAATAMVRRGWAPWRNAAACPVLSLYYAGEADRSACARAGAKRAADKGRVETARCEGSVGAT